MADSDIVCKRLPRNFVCDSFKPSNISFWSSTHSKLTVKQISWLYS